MPLCESTKVTTCGWTHPEIPYLLGTAYAAEGGGPTCSSLERSMVYSLLALSLAYTFFLSLSLSLFLCITNIHLNTIREVGTFLAGGGGKLYVYVTGIALIYCSVSFFFFSLKIELAKEPFHSNTLEYLLHIIQRSC